MQPEVAILLCNPKTPYNVGSVIRNLAEYECGTELRWTGERVEDERDFKQVANASRSGCALRRRYRLPREERIADYKHINWHRSDFPEAPLAEFIARRFVPICVEVLDTAIPLPFFTHPERVVYVFGPEDGSVPKGIRHKCHGFVRIPTKHCLNLAVASGTVLYDRAAKTALGGLSLAAG